MMSISPRPAPRPRLLVRPEVIARVQARLGEVQEKVRCIANQMDQTLPSEQQQCTQEENRPDQPSAEKPSFVEHEIVVETLRGPTRTPGWYLTGK